MSATRQKSGWMVPLVEAVDRPLGATVATTSFILAYLLAVRDVLPPIEFQDYEWWWIALSAVTLSWGVINAAFWRTISLGTLRLWWTLVPVIGAVRMVTIGWGLNLHSEDQFHIESWIGGSTYIVYLVFVLRPVALMAVVVASAFLPALGMFMATGSVPFEALRMAPIYASYILLVVLFLAIRAVLIRLQSVAVEAQEQRRLSAIATATAKTRAQFVRLVHDEVLASLSAALHFEGAPPKTVRAHASQALTVLNDDDLHDAASTMGCAHMRTRLFQIADAIEVPFEHDIEASDGEISAAVATTMLGATREAMRNSVKHAGSGANRTLFARIGPHQIHIEIADRGPGFSQSMMREDRMGVRHSILGALSHLEGGHVEIDTSHGTRVMLQWTR